jgi:hypothetical protein
MSLGFDNKNRRTRDVYALVLGYWLTPGSKGDA